MGGDLLQEYENGLRRKYTAPASALSCSCLTISFFLSLNIFLILWPLKQAWILVAAML